MRVAPQVRGDARGKPILPIRRIIDQFAGDGHADSGRFGRLSQILVQTFSSVAI
jgi:hypothetical protein